MHKHILLVTTNGSRAYELDRLISSVQNNDSILLLLLYQAGAKELNDLPKNVMAYYSDKQMPLSTARNFLLSAIPELINDNLLNDDSYVILADDDCWYPDDFFHRADLNDDGYIFSIVDPEKNKIFTTFDLRKRRTLKKIKPYEFMFYGASISIAVKYKFIKGIFFHSKLGLGNKINQGEESLFLFELSKKFKNINFMPRPDLMVFHPWKMSTNTKNHESLGYFMGLAVRLNYFSVIPFVLFFYTKYIVASLVKFDCLYLKILMSSSFNFMKGLMDSEGVLSE